jgi:methionyl aminopeptidase
MLLLMSVDTPEQLEGLRRVGRLVASTLTSLRAAVAPGVSTGELVALAAEAFAACGARSGPILTYGYPASICVCVDDEVVHGIPGKRRLQAGQLVTLDVAAELDGYHADAAITVPVATADRRALRLLGATRASLRAGIRAAQPGARLRDIGEAIERTANARGFEVFKELTGHGIGREMHEPPTVFNWPAPQANQRLTPGLVFTIEPMLASGSVSLRLDRDGWTVRARDGMPSAHEEHTIMIATGGPVVLTAGN